MDGSITELRPRAMEIDAVYLSHVSLGMDMSLLKQYGSLYINVRDWKHWYLHQIYDVYFI